MAVDSGTWSVDWGLTVGIVSLFATLAITLPQLLLQWRQDCKKNLEEDAVLRAEWAARLRSGSAGAAYRDTLARTLTWLDRIFGSPGSFRALGVCFLIAAAYAWVTFFIGWGLLGGSGGIGGFQLLPNTMNQLLRSIVAASAVVLPIVTFFLTRWLARFIRKIETRLRERTERRWPARLGQRTFRIALWLTEATLVFAGLYAIIETIPELRLALFKEELLTEIVYKWIFIAFYIFLFIFTYLSVRVGRYTNRVFGYRPAGGIAAFVTGAMLTLLSPIALFFLLLALWLAMSHPAFSDAVVLWALAAAITLAAPFAAVCSGTVSLFVVIALANAIGSITPLSLSDVSGSETLSRRAKLGVSCGVKVPVG